MQQDCALRYPILLLHGMGFNDHPPFHYYWGGIPRILRAHGACVYCSGQDGNGSVEGNARQLVPLIQRILRETGREKLHIIAHSKGGLEARYLISTMGMGDVIASLTTMASPHNGSATVDWLMAHFRVIIRWGSACTDVWRRITGDRDPRTFAAIEGFTTGAMARFNAENPDDERVFYQSFAFVMEHWYSDPLMGFANVVVSRFEGENDGLISPRNARWTNFRGIYRGTGWRGISHPDETHYTRLPLSRKTPGEGQLSDVTELYIQVVRELKEREVQW